MNSRNEIHEALIVEADQEFSTGELCERCGLASERLLELVSYGIIEPRRDSAGAAPEQWRFRAVMARRVVTVTRLQRDLGVNLQGAALALDLLDEIRALRRQLAS